MIGRLVPGLTMIALGVVFLLGALDVIEDPGAIVGAWWPIVFVAIGAALAVEQRRLGAGPLVFGGLGILLLAATTDVVALDGRILWPLALVGAGVWLLLRPRVSGAKGPRVEDPRVGVTAIFGDRKVRSAAVPLEHAALTSIFGDVDFDLREAEAGEDMAVDVTVIFGDVDVTVPPDWRVEMGANALFGDIDHRPPPRPATAEAPLLRFRGFVLFGDVTVRQ